MLFVASEFLLHLSVIINSLLLYIKATDIWGRVGVLNFFFLPIFFFIFMFLFRFFFSVP
jgi:hypothetical protein